VTVNGTPVTFTWLSSNLINTDITTGSGAVVVVRRTTPSDQVSCDFVDGSVLGEADLDANAIQALYLLQEAEDDFDNSLQLDLNDDLYDFKGRRGKNLGTPVADNDAATAWWAKEWVKQVAPTLDGSGDAYDAHGHRITNLQTPVVDSDAVNGFWVKAVAPTLDGTGDAYDAHNHRLTNLKTPVIDSDAVNGFWVKAVAPTIDNTGDAYDAHTHRIANLKTPIVDTDATNAFWVKAWVQQYVTSYFPAVYPSETVTVKTYGAVLNGIADDSTAFNTARGAVQANGTIRVPEGYWNVPTPPTSGPSTPVLWQMTGNVGSGVIGVAVTSGGQYASTPTVVFGPPQLPGGRQATGTAIMSGTAVASIQITDTGTGYTAAPPVSFSGGGVITPATAVAFANAPIIGIGTDIVESVVEGSKYFAKSSSRQNDGPVLRVDQTINHSGGTLGNVIPAFRVNQTVTNVDGLVNFGWANSTILTCSAIGSGEHVALAALATRPADCLADGKGPRSPMWGLYVETNDLTNQPADVSGSLIGFEHDMFANGEDSFVGKRINHHMVMGRQDPDGVKARFTHGSVIDSKDVGLGYSWLDQSYCEVGYAMQMAWVEAGFDASKGFSLAEAPAFKMKDGMHIAFTEDNKSRLRHLSGGLRYYYDGNELLNINDTGQVAIAAGLQVGSTLTYTYAHIPDNPTVPANTADPMGIVGDTIFAGAYLYRKTSSGWLRAALSTF
jgi:hypothetical protein